MAKKMGRPKTSTRQDVSIKFDKTLSGKARLIAQGKGTPQAEYLSELAREIIDRDYAQLMRELEGGGKALTTEEQFRFALGAHPFRPFTIHLADGRQVDVARREYAAISPKGGKAVVLGPNDEMQALELSSVTKLSFEGPTPPGPQRGKAAR